MKWAARGCSSSRPAPWHERSHQELYSSVLHNPEAFPWRNQTHQLQIPSQEQPKAFQQ